MAKPDYAIDCSDPSDTSIDLVDAQETINRSTAVNPIYLYAISRIPMAPPELHSTGKEAPCKPRFLLGLFGQYSSVHLAVKASGAPILSHVLAHDDAEYNTCAHNLDYPTTLGDQLSEHFAIFEFRLLPIFTGELYELDVNGIWCYMQAGTDTQTAPITMRALDLLPTTDPPCEPNDFVSAWDSCGALSRSMNTLTYLNSGGFGTGVFSVPLGGNFYISWN